MDKYRAEEKAAVDTTIVGGRPPGCGRDVGTVPRGMEILMKKASVDSDFRELLLTKRSGAAEEIQLELQPNESMMLDAIPELQLEKIIDQTHVPERHRAAFLGKTAAAMMLALGVAVLTGCPGQSKGIAPDKPPRKQEQKSEAEPNPTDKTPKPEPRGTRPDRPEPISLGIQPDRPDKEK